MSTFTTANLAARQGDTVSTGHGCDGTTTLAAPSQSTVFVAGQLWCRLGDFTVSHEIPDDGDPPDCTSHIADITGSSATVYVAGIKCARVTDGADAGTISASTQGTVFAG